MSGRRALEVLGMAPYEARESADRFRRHNVSRLEMCCPSSATKRAACPRPKPAAKNWRRSSKADRAALDRIGVAGWEQDLEGASDERASRVA